jgi:hypothetical protein
MNKALAFVAAVFAVGAVLWSVFPGFRLIASLALWNLTTPSELGRYRFLVTTRIEVDGEIKSASSVIELRVTPRIESYNFGFDSFGITPFFVLNPGGDMLFVSAVYTGTYETLTPYSAPPKDRFQREDLSSTIISVYYPKGVKGKWIYVRPAFDRAQKTKAPDNISLELIWVPRNAATYRDLRFLHAHELSTPDWSQIFGHSIKYLDTTIEPTKAPLVMRQALNAPWLESVRNGLPSSHLRGRNAFELGER